jgi:phosphoribosylglycinamide formyltransferase-1
MKNIVCLISGRGSNLQSLLAIARKEDWARAVPARVVAVIANRPDAAGLAIARDAGVPTVVVDHRDYASREAFDTALAQAIDRFAPDLVVLAGFMRVLTDEFVARYRGRLINVHPSLLPAFPGLATHRQALAAGVRVHGATVHFVSREVDGGPIVGQAVVPVRPGDTEAELAARVLEQEHVLLPRCVRAVVEGRVTLVEGRVRCTDEVAEWLRIGLPVVLRVGQ